MPFTPARSDDAPVTVLVLPGASLMHVRTLAPGVAEVRCPGCEAIHVYSASTAGPGDVMQAFVHEVEDRPILARIEAAMAARRRWIQEVKRHLLALMSGEP